MTKYLWKTSIPDEVDIDAVQTYTTTEVELSIPEVKDNKDGSVRFPIYMTYGDMQQLVKFSSFLPSGDDKIQEAYAKMLGDAQFQGVVVVE